MRFFRLQAYELNRYLLAIVAGLLLAAAFPKIHFAGMAWVAPAMILGSAMGMEGKAAFRIGYVAGLAYYLASLYWLLLIPVTFAPILGWLALAGFLSLYPATWVWLCWSIYPRKSVNFVAIAGSEGSRVNNLRHSRLTVSATGLTGETPAGTTEANRIEANSSGKEKNTGLGFGFPAALENFLGTTWIQRLGWSICCAALWVAWEMVQARLFSGFPWNFLGVSQYETLPLIQIASYTGVYGVSFLLVWFSVGLLCAAATMMRRPGSAWIWGREFLFPFFAVVAVLTFGLNRIMHAPQPEARLKVLMIQPSIPQTMIWDSTESTARFAQLLEMTDQALTNKPDLLVWPEAAVPSLLRWDTNQIYKGETAYGTITNLVQKHKTWLITGADDAEPRADAPDGADFYNSSFLFSPQGEIAAIYRKQNLVIFGEWVPFSRWFPFLRKISGITGEFTPGKGPVPFHIPELGLTTSVLICFEDVFPHLAREYVQEDTDFLLNLTNDGWFRQSAAQWQHAANAAFRAVENGRPLVRVTNNGLTCWIDAYGGMHEVNYPGFENIYQSGYKLASVPMLGGAGKPLSFYTRHGDWFGWGCVGLGAVAAAWALASRKRARTTIEG